MLQQKVQLKLNEINGFDDCADGKNDYDNALMEIKRVTLRAAHRHTNLLFPARKIG